MNAKSDREIIKELVIARLQVFSPDLRFSIGSKDGLTPDEMIKHVHEEDEIGETVTKIELDYLRNLKNTPCLMKHLI